MRVLRVAELAAAEAETRELIVVVACWWWCMVWSSSSSESSSSLKMCEGFSLFLSPQKFCSLFLHFQHVRVYLGEFLSISIESS